MDSTLSPSQQLLLNHFLSLPRPDTLVGPPSGVPDTTTLAAHDFDVDNRTGFMPPHPPLARLPREWEVWESTLDKAIQQHLQLGDRPDLEESEKIKSERWREGVRSMPILPITGLKDSEVKLRRTHHVLAWIMHFYIHSLPPTDPINIPPPITLPLLQTCAQLMLPPVLTYSDDVLYNWKYLNPPAASSPRLGHEFDDDSIEQSDTIPTIDNLACQTLFTGTKDEEEFYLSSARIELKGVEVLEIMRNIMDETFVGDDIAITRITAYLKQMASSIRGLKSILLQVKQGCDPDYFYNHIRPWFRGLDSQDVNRRQWNFEGLEMDKELKYPTELSGPSAGQSALIHALDIFLGVDHSIKPTNDGTDATGTTGKLSFFERMQLYMPRYHRNFLTHLASSSHPLRAVVSGSADQGLESHKNDNEESTYAPSTPELREAYNDAVRALKEFRDAHMTIVALYIIVPARRLEIEAKGEMEGEGDDESKDKDGKKQLKGTGGTDLVRFLKGVRNQTLGTLLPPA